MDYLHDGFPTLDMKEVYMRWVQQHCLGKSHFDGFNDWITNATYQNITQPVVSLKNRYIVNFANMIILKPHVEYSLCRNKLTPEYIRIQCITYSEEMHVDMLIKDEFGKVDPSMTKRIMIGKIPTMLRSKMSNLYGLSRKQRALMGEDPDNPGGYLQGKHYVVMYNEKLDLNKFIMYSGEKKNKKNQTSSRCLLSH